MVNHFHSLADVRAQFSIDASMQSAGQVLEALRAQLVSLHPDRTGGVFPSKGDEERYHKTQEAIAFVAFQEAFANAMVPAAAIPEIIRAAQASIQHQSAPWSRSPELRRELSSSIRGRSFGPKLTSGILLTVSSALLAFLRTASTHPVLGVLASQGWFRYFLMTLWSLSACAFALSWYHERRADSKAEFLLSDEALADAFQHVAIGSQYSRKRPGTFQRMDLEEAMQYVYRDYHKVQLIRLLLYGPQHLDRTARSRAAEAHIRTLLDRRAIRRVDEPGVEEWFEIDSSLIPVPKTKDSAT